MDRSYDALESATFERNWAGVGKSYGFYEALVMGLMTSTAKNSRWWLLDVASPGHGPSVGLQCPCVIRQFSAIPADRSCRLQKRFLHN